MTKTRLKNASTVLGLSPLPVSPFAGPGHYFVKSWQGTPEEKKVDLPDAIKALQFPRKNLL